ncbi:MAG: hypothetical protein ABI477_08360 [Chryseolinea sp.]
MKKSAIALIIFACALAVGCQEEKIVSGFAITSATGNEGDGAQTITIDLGKMTTATTTLTFEVGGDAALDGDYRVAEISQYAVEAPYTLTIPEGNSTATIHFDLIDDNQIETRNEVIYFHIKDISDEGITKRLTRTVFAYEIVDNDSSPASGMQVDLSWTLGDNIRINAANFDMYLATSLSLTSDGEINTFESVEQFQSTNETGFETFVVGDTIQDRQYYIVMKYVSGTYDANVSLHLSQGSNYGSASGRVEASYVGKYVYYGPLNKAGNRFSFQ